MTEKNQDFIVISRATREKVEAAKNFIEQRYSKMLQQESQKKLYWQQLHQKMEVLNLAPWEQEELKKKIIHEETLQLREERRKIMISEFVPVKVIGKGAFGEVRLCRWQRSGEPVAVKKLKKKDMICKNKVMQSREERNVLANADKNPWVVGLKCSFQDNDNLYLVMEYLPGGDLMNLLMKKDIFTHQEAQFYTAEILMALDSVHKMNYIHRDLKPDNVLIDAHGHIKLSDFGLCKHTEVRPNRLTDNVRKDQPLLNNNGPNPNAHKDFHKRNRKLAYSAVGTPDYVAPQVQNKTGYTETVDWWSMGVILFQMLVGYPPFASEQSSQTWKKIQNWRLYLCIPSDAKVSLPAADLIRKLIADPQDRLGTRGVDEIKAHPFFNGVNWDRLRDTKSPYIPQVKGAWDTRNFDAYEEEESWDVDTKQRPRKKNTQFIGYTYKPFQESNSALLKALLDLDQYKPTATNTHLYPNKEQQCLSTRFKKDKNQKKELPLKDNLFVKESIKETVFHKENTKDNPMKESKDHLYMQKDIINSNLISVSQMNGYKDQIGQKDYGGYKESGQKESYGFKEFHKEGYRDMCMTVTTMPTQQTLTKDVEKNKFNFSDTPEKLGLTKKTQKSGNKKPMPKISPRHAEKQSPCAKEPEEKKMKVKIIQKKYC